MKEPRLSNSRNRPTPACELPASGAATAFNPGTNFATSSERIPYFRKIFSVRRTQESGSSATRQMNRRTLAPSAPSQLEPGEVGNQAGGHTVKKYRHEVQLAGARQRSACQQQRYGGQRERACSAKTHTNSRTDSRAGSEIGRYCPSAPNLTDATGRFAGLESTSGSEKSFVRDPPSSCKCAFRPRC